MFRGLIDYLTFGYTYICKARGKITDGNMRTIADAAEIVVANAESVMGSANVPVGKEDRADLQEALKIYQHIDEMTTFLQSMEIV